jgi:hypothetical protein
MSSFPFKFIISDPMLSTEAKKYGFHVLSRSDNFVFVRELSDCMNAERGGADAIIWNSSDYDLLKELSPKNREYGWALVSINIPIYIYLSDLNQIDKLSDIAYHGFYADHFDILLNSQKKLETLSS